MYPISHLVRPASSAGCQPSERTSPKRLYIDQVEPMLVPDIGSLRRTLHIILNDTAYFQGYDATKVQRSITLLCDYYKSEFDTERQQFPGTLEQFKIEFAESALIASQLHVYTSGMQQRRSENDLEAADSPEVRLDPNEYIDFTILAQAIEEYFRANAQGRPARKLLF
ncbi:MAG: hypothetical protein O3A01_02875 [bacterium]|nr:hypothetical protein [bacterium]